MESKIYPFTYEQAYEFARNYAEKEECDYVVIKIFNYELEQWEYTFLSLEEWLYSDNNYFVGAEEVVRFDVEGYEEDMEEELYNFYAIIVILIMQIFNI